MCENCDPEYAVEIEEGFKCVDCRFDTMRGLEYYMVSDELWASAGMGKRFGDGMLCIGCLENRIGRTLVPADFPNLYPLNAKVAPFPKSDRLMDRMGYAEN